MFSAYIIIVLFLGFSMAFSRESQNFIRLRGLLVENLIYKEPHQ